jgi:hypothetical protein
VEFYAAYQSKADFEKQHPEEDSVKAGVERVNFLIQHQLAVPDEPPQKLLERIVSMASGDRKFKDRRRNFYDWQIELIGGGVKPNDIVKELDQLVQDFNAQTLANSKKCKWETVITVLAVFGAALAAFAGFAPAALSTLTHTAGAPGYVALASGANAAGIGVWRKLSSMKEIDAPHRIAAPGAMFHQTGAKTGIQYLTGRPPEERQLRPLRF